MAGYSGQTEITRRVEFNAIGLDPLIRSHMIAHGHDQHPAYQNLMDGIDDWLVELEGTDPDHAEFVREHREAFEKKLHDYAMKEGFGEGSVAGHRTHIVNETGSGGMGGKSGEKRAARQAYKEALLATLMDHGGLPEFIAEQVFGDMSEQEIADIVGRIEAETGMSIEEYAAEILGEDAAQKLPDETVAEYNLRIVQALGAAIMDDDGNIKPEFRGSVLADLLETDADYREIISQVNEWRAREARSDTELAEDVDRETDGEYAAGHFAGYHLEGPQAVDAGRINQDEQRDIEAHDASAAAENDDGFGGMSGFAAMNTDSLVSPPSALDQASLSGTFNASSALPSDDPPPSIDMASQLNPDTLTT